MIRAHKVHKISTSLHKNIYIIAEIAFKRDKWHKMYIFLYFIDNIANNYTAITHEIIHKHGFRRLIVRLAKNIKKQTNYRNSFQSNENIFTYLFVIRRYKRRKTN